MARVNLYLPDALLDKARRVMPPERSISAVLRNALEIELASIEAAEIPEGAAAS